MAMSHVQGHGNLLGTTVMTHPQQATFMNRAIVVYVATGAEGNIARHDIPLALRAVRRFRDGVVRPHYRVGISTPAGQSALRTPPTEKRKWAKPSTPHSCEESM